MKQLFYRFIAVLFLGLTACNTAPKKEESKEGETAEVKAEAVAAPNTLTEAEKAEGWILMFDGESTEGWREYDNPDFPDKGWYIEEGKIGRASCRERV